MGIHRRIIFFYLLIMMMFISGNYAAREMLKENNKELEKNPKIGNQNLMNDPTNVLRLHSMDSPKETRTHTHHMMGHIDPSVMVFFFPQDLQIGNKLRIYFPKRKPLSASQFLSKQKADSIPFSSEQLPNLLELFSFPRNSPQAKAMEDTLRECENMAIEGETKVCVTSYESMLGFAHSILGADAELRVLSTTRQPPPSLSFKNQGSSTTHLTEQQQQQQSSLNPKNLVSPIARLPKPRQTLNLDPKNPRSTTTHLTKSSNENTLLQNYTILETPKQISAPKMVACHTMPYPYAVFYCHYQTSESKVLKVLLEAESGDRVEGVALCHMDTSHWGSGHVSFKVLGIEPGSSPVCHFLPADNLVWVEKVPILV